MSSEYKIESVFILEGVNSSNGRKKRGTCFAISPNLVLTNYHTLKIHQDEISLFTSRGYQASPQESISLKLVDYSVDSDYAILCTENFTFDNFIRLGYVNTNNVNVKTCGYPSTRQFRHATIDTHTRTDFSSNENDIYSYEVSQVPEVTNYQGMSGSPIMYNDFVIGVLSYQESNSALYVISIEDLKGFISRHSIEIKKMEYISDIEMITLFKSVYKEIEKEIESEITEFNEQTELLSNLTDIYEYFELNLELLFRILNHVMCNNGEKVNRDYHIAINKFMTYLVVLKTLSDDFVFPTVENISTFAKNINSLLFNISWKDKKIDEHISEIVKYIARKNKYIPSSDAFFLSCLKDYGGLDCSSCNKGLLINVNSKVNGIVTDFMDSESTNVLKGCHSLMKYKPEINVDFKCGQCISKIEEYEKVKNIW